MHNIRDLFLEIINDDTKLSAFAKALGNGTAAVLAAKWGYETTEDELVAFLYRESVDCYDELDKTDDFADNTVHPVFRLPAGHCFAADLCIA